MAEVAEDIERKARDLLAPSGLHVFGWFTTKEGGEVLAGLLVGNAGRTMWPVFSASAEFADGVSDSLNRWTERICDTAADELGAEARYPFGDRVWPFQQWAKAASGMRPSPLGLLIDRQYGLWIAFRAALMFPDLALPRATGGSGPHPCETCAKKPCLGTCPVNAFSENGYDVAACRDHVGSEAGTVCREQGCLARLSCPIGSEHRYGLEQQAFHMAAFLGADLKSGG